jgi:hypothetical protein
MNKMEKMKKITIEMSFHMDANATEEEVAGKIQKLFESVNQSNETHLAEDTYPKQERSSKSEELQPLPDGSLKGVRVQFTNKDISRIDINAGYETRIWEKVTCDLNRWDDFRDRFRSDYPDFNIDIRTTPI